MTYAGIVGGCPRRHLRFRRVGCFGHCAAAAWLMSAWQRRVWRTLTDEQKTTVGEPPTEADLPSEV